MIASHGSGVCLSEHGCEAVCLVCLLSVPYVMALMDGALLQMARADSKKGSEMRHHRRAEELLRAALQGNVRSAPCRAAALHNLAHALHGLRQPMGAIQHCCAAAALDPKAAAGPVRLRADICARIGDPSNALEVPPSCFSAVA